MGEFSDPQFVIILTLCSISGLGLLLVTLSILLTNLLSLLRYRIYLYSTISILLLSITLCLPIQIYSSLCETQAFLNTFSALSCIIWSSLAFYNLYSEIIYEKTFRDAYFLALGYILPFLLAFPEVFTKNYAYNHNWCSFDSGKINDLLTAGEIFVPMLVGIFFNLTVSLRVNYFMNNFERGFRPAEYFMKKAMFRHMIKLPICINLCLLPPMIYEYYYLSNNQSSLVLNVVGIAGQALLGYCASICFMSIFIGAKKASVLIETPSSTQGTIYESIHSVQEEVK